MTKPDWCPKDVWEVAECAVITGGACDRDDLGAIYLPHSDKVEIARLILAERRACAVRAGRYLMLETALDVSQILACEQSILGTP